jgi:hypothetical protein
MSYVGDVMEGEIEQIEPGVTKNGEPFWKMIFKDDVTIYSVFKKELIKGLKIGDVVNYLPVKYGDFTHIKYITKHSNIYETHMEVQHRIGDYND